MKSLLFQEICKQNDGGEIEAGGEGNQCNTENCPF